MNEIESKEITSEPLREESRGRKAKGNIKYFLNETATGFLVKISAGATAAAAGLTGLLAVAGPSSLEPDRFREREQTIDVVRYSDGTFTGIKLAAVGSGDRPHAYVTRDAQAGTAILSQRGKDIAYFGNVSTAEAPMHDVSTICHAFTQIDCKKLQEEALRPTLKGNVYEFFKVDLHPDVVQQELKKESKTF